jgi:hypothetical protein
MGGILSSSVSFCLYVVALSVYRASNVCAIECNSRRLVLQLQSAEVSLNGDQQLCMKLDDQC